MTVIGSGAPARALGTEQVTKRLAVARSGTRALPSGRAVAGGLLVAVAAVGAFAVAGGGDDTPSTTYAVVTAAVPAGAPLADAVEARPIALPEGTAERVVPGTSLQQLEGWVAAVDLAPGDPVLRSHLVRPVAGEGYEVAIGLDPERALAGRVSAGGTVDVLATTGGCTALLVAGAELVAVERPGRELGGGRTVVSLRVPSPADALAVVQAQDAGTITLARSTTVGGDATSAAAPAPVCTPAAGGGA